jgi:phospholipase/carboxylesterase
MGRQWFALDLRDVNERWRGVSRAAPTLAAFLAEELRRRGLPGGSLALVGFSQGTMMALHVGLRLAQAPAAIVGYSGLLAMPEPPDAIERAAAEIRARPPVWLAHGARDDLIPAQALFVSANALAAAGVPVEWHLSPEIGHGIDPEGLRQGGEFLRRAFAFGAG